MLETKIIMNIGLVNIAIGLIYFIVLIIKKDRTRAFLMLLFIILCPVIAILFLFLAWLQQKFFLKKEIDLSDLSFHTDHQNIIANPDFEKEINVVSIEEALIISDNHNKRRVILDVLKEDYNKSISMISSALNSEDSETSHYAASVIADVKSNFKVTVQQMVENLKKYPDDPEITIMILDYIHDFLDKKVLSEIEESTYVEQYEKLMVQLYEKNKTKITSTMYKQVMIHLLSIHKSDEALVWGERALEEYPNDLITYKGILKLYYETGEKNKFFETLTKLKESKIDYDNECLELIRFYQ